MCLPSDLLFFWPFFFGGGTRYLYSLFRVNLGSDVIRFSLGQWLVKGGREGGGTIFFLKLPPLL